ncbi:MBL fold metallo-hydrolase [Pararhizobium sp. IMCC21322]|uniref:MBL fold metallo-hydrolase n=1 Tax=Pararhizobium sp. IMCC21322 TaxID=3067903 RepID=UPI002740AC93|nr:MBL fold metallo-hydrolase [Pararhizobium sp. IMCC21322]
MSLRFTILGSGSSPGVPRIGNEWGACDPDNPKNRRRRCSLLVEKRSKDGVTRIIIDTGPDFREQCLSQNIDWADAVLYTHAHADHVHGIDDLRAFVINRRQRVHIYADRVTLDRLHAGFDYCFNTPTGSSYPPILVAHEIAHGETLSIDGPGGIIDILPFKQIHGDILSFGFRIGDLAYSSDISALPSESAALLSGLSHWIVDALRYDPHPSHFSLREALEAIEQIGPKQAVLTHMHIDLDYETVRQETPEYVEPAYDGWFCDI